ncbi:MAG: hypothetical protein ACI3VJ_06285 [Hominicoprocola sp.]
MHEVYEREKHADEVRSNRLHREMRNMKPLQRGVVPILPKLREGTEKRRGMMIITTNVTMRAGEEAERIAQKLRREGWVEETGNRIVFELTTDEMAISMVFYREV